MSSEKPRYRVKATRQDSYLSLAAGPATPFGNPASGLMSPQLDRTALGGPSAAQYSPSPAELYALYLTNGLAARIVDLAVDDSFSRGFVFNGDTTDNYVQDEFKRLNVELHLSTGQRWAELLGASAVIVYTDDTSDLTRPLDPENPGNIIRLRPVDLTSIQAAPDMSKDYVDDPTDPLFGEWAVYSVAAHRSGVMQHVHHTRLIKLRGADLPDAVARMYDLPWMGKSVLSGVAEELRRYENINRWTERMFERKQQLIYYMEGLAAYLSEMNDDGSLTDGAATVQQRVQMVDTVRSILNTVVVDNGTVDEDGRTTSKGDKIEAQDLNLSNVPQTISIAQMNVAAKSGYSVTVLFGRSASGLNSSGDRELESHYNRCGVVRTRAQPGLDYLTRLVMAQPGAKRKLNKKKKVTPSVSFGPLWLPSELEGAQAAQATATANFNNANAISTLLQQAISPDAALNWMVQEGLFGITEEALPEVLKYVTANLAEQKELTTNKNTRPDKEPSL